MAGLTAAAVTAVGIAVLAPSWLPGHVRVVACYDAAVVVMLISYATVIVRATPAETMRHASEEDPGRNWAFVIALVAVAFGFFSAFAVLGHDTQDLPAQHQPTVVVLGFAAVALGWLLIHTVFVFRYARLYYRDGDRDRESDRGLNFPGAEDPDYLDLAYFSLVVGMTFQVSDVQVTARNVRALVLLQGLISFFYYTSLVALVVNIVSSLLH
jgi:uncharacterized membrane protein